MAKHILNLILAYILVSCNVAKKDLPNLDSDFLFYSGESIIKSDTVYFKDCATDRTILISPKSKQFNDIKTRLLNMPENKALFSLFRGKINSNNSLEVNKIINFEQSNVCNSLSLISAYVNSNGDTLTLNNDYTASFASSKGEKSKGEWGKTQNFSGLLMFDNKLYEFIINYGTQTSSNNIFLVFSNIMGDKAIFKPLN